MTDREERHCELCARPLGARIEKHHLVPRSRGGRETVELHPICHRKIHSLLSEREIADNFASIAALRAHPEIVRFVKWIAKRPPDFHRRTERAQRRR